jgi:hypothetical protein
MEEKEVDPPTTHIRETEVLSRCFLRRATIGALLLPSGG